MKLSLLVLAVMSLKAFATIRSDIGAGESPFSGLYSCYGLEQLKGEAKRNIFLSVNSRGPVTIVDKPGLKVELSFDEIAGSIFLNVRSSRALADGSAEIQTVEGSPLSTLFLRNSSFGGVVCGDTNANVYQYVN